MLKKKSKIHADKKNRRLNVGKSQLFANPGLKKMKEGKKWERKKAEVEKGREPRNGEKKSLPQDSRDVVGIISTFAWMRVLYSRRIQPLPFPTRPRFLFPRCEFGIPHGGCDCRPLARKYAS